ncbi:MAG: polyphosphate polymerase domain-containing protein [Hyphomicrobium sp.]
MPFTSARETSIEACFQPISLDALNAKAAMLERLDNKYVVTESVLQRATVQLSRHFDILEIDGVRTFRYETWYFDDEQRRSYFDHHQGRRRRVKVRVRKYVDANLCFVEVKLKDKRGITVKKRMPYPVEQYGQLDSSAYEHIERSYTELYQNDFGLKLQRVLEVNYTRMTLVAREGGERMTIDTQLSFSNGLDERPLNEGLFIIETKSANGNGLADKVLRELNQHPTKHCSKYCVGTVVTGGAGKFNKFRPALRRLGHLPGTEADLSAAH